MASQEFQGFLDSSLLNEEDCRQMIYRSEREHDARMVGVNVDQHFTSQYRKVLTTWMFCVCKDLRQDNNVFPLAVALLDELFLSTRIDRENYQSTAAVALHIAGKVRAYMPIKATQLAYLCGGATTADKLLTLEVKSLDTLSWVADRCLSTDLICYILHIMHAPREDYLNIYNLCHPKIFCALCDGRSAMKRPVLITLACMHLTMNQKYDYYENRIDGVCKSLYITKEELHQCCDLVDIAIVSFDENYFKINA
ncbi:cyclin D-like protein [Murine herpesvirus strain 4556]|uniref:72 protein n=3 Tax=Orthoherpesviridae TaxID=3044472 RepID=P89883_MHV68|nr:cyclin D homolog [Murid gammaherpesvirus 4]ACV74548.1 cyclin D-like protein [Murine herpesvirus strain 72]AXP99156.1 cyclin D-like protein [synthetic construct]QJQ80261.1 cyclin D-like protein [Murine herpesvirus]UNZ86779.1 cyclin D-like protein [Murine herpesvirus strain 4556]AAB50015.1 v-cyclin [Murid gammaherpesvirus 4]